MTSVTAAAAMQKDQIRDQAGNPGKAPAEPGSQALRRAPGTQTAAAVNATPNGC